MMTCATFSMGYSGMQTYLQHENMFVLVQNHCTKPLKINTCVHFFDRVGTRVNTQHSSLWIDFVSCNVVLRLFTYKLAYIPDVVGLASERKICNYYTKPFQLYVL